MKETNCEIVKIYVKIVKFRSHSDLFLKPFETFHTLNAQKTFYSFVKTFFRKYVFNPLEHIFFLSFFFYFWKIIFVRFENNVYTF